MTRILDCSSVCPGNCDASFVTLVKKQGSNLLDKTGQVVANIDTALGAVCQDGSLITVQIIDCALL